MDLNVIFLSNQTLPVITYFYLWSLVYLHMLHYYDFFLQILFIYLGRNEKKLGENFKNTDLIIWPYHEILMGFSWSCHKTRTCLNFANLYVLWFHEFLKYFFKNHLSCPAMYNFRMYLQFFITKASSRKVPRIFTYLQYIFFFILL